MVGDLGFRGLQYGLDVRLWVWGLGLVGFLVQRPLESLEQLSYALRLLLGILRIHTTKSKVPAAAFATITPTTLAPTPATEVGGEVEERWEWWGQVRWEVGFGR